MEEQESRRRCTKRSKSVVVKTDTDRDGREYVVGCSGKSGACMGLGCYLAEFGGDWPFKEDC